MYIIEKRTALDLRGYYMNWHEVWEQIGNELSHESAINICNAESKKSTCKFRVRDFWNGQVIYEIYNP